MRIELASEVATKLARIQKNRERGCITAREVFFQSMDALLRIETESWGDVAANRFYQSIERVCFIMMEHPPIELYIEDDELRIVL